MCAPFSIEKVATKLQECRKDNDHETHIDVNKHKNKSEDAAYELNSKSTPPHWIGSKWMFLWHFLCNQSVKVFSCRKGRKAIKSNQPQSKTISSFVKLYPFFSCFVRAQWKTKMESNVEKFDSKSSAARDAFDFLKISSKVLNWSIKIQNQLRNWSNKRRNTQIELDKHYQKLFGATDAVNADIWIGIQVS